MLIVWSAMSISIPLRRIVNVNDLGALNTEPVYDREGGLVNFDITVVPVLESGRQLASTSFTSDLTLKAGKEADGITAEGLYDPSLNIETNFRTYIPVWSTQEGITFYGNYRGYAAGSWYPRRHVFSQKEEEEEEDEEADKAARPNGGIFTIQKQQRQLKQLQAAYYSSRRFIPSKNRGLPRLDPADEPLHMPKKNLPKKVGEKRKHVYCVRADSY